MAAESGSPGKSLELLLRLFQRWQVSNPRRIHDLGPWPVKPYTGHDVGGVFPSENTLRESD
jgi:hypothetical protein